MKSTIEEFWQLYLDSLADPESAKQQGYLAWGFGNTLEMADELGALANAGIKTATCGILWEYEAEDELLPKIGELNIILDGQGNPICLTELTEVAIKPFNEVDAQFAFEEGEGDRSLAYWRRVHWAFFSEILPNLGLEMKEDAPLVCERFRVIFRGSEIDD